MKQLVNYENITYFSWLNVHKTYNYSFPKKRSNVTLIKNCPYIYIYTPVAGHTRSRKRKLATIPSNTYQSPSSPDILQSQARANSPKQHLSRQVPPVFSPVNLHQVSPRVRENVSHIPLSQTHSPSAATGATRKRKFKCNQVSPLDNNSPMVKRLRSSKLNLVSWVGSYYIAGYDLTEHMYDLAFD